MIVATSDLVWIRALVRSEVLVFNEEDAIESIYLGATHEAIRRSCERFVAEGILPDHLLDLTLRFREPYFTQVRSIRLAVAWCVINRAVLLRALALVEEIRAHARGIGSPVWNAQWEALQTPLLGLAFQSEVKPFSSPDFCYAHTDQQRSDGSPKASITRVFSAYGNPSLVRCLAALRAMGCTLTVDLANLASHPPLLLLLPVSVRNGGFALRTLPAAYNTEPVAAPAVVA